MVRVSCYVRVSTKEQSLENQIPALRDYCESRGYEIVAVYQDSESAWKQGQQTQLEDCKAAAGRHEFDILLVWALDRLSRQGPEAMLGLVRYFRGYSVKVLSLQESWLETLDEANVPLFLSIAAWLGQMESNRRSERIRASVAVTKANGGVTRKGKRLGRPAGRTDGPGVKRKKSGYNRRWEKEREVNNLPSPVEREKRLIATLWQ